MESIFETIVRRENDHTNLLRNILDRYPSAASLILTYLLGEKGSPWDASKYEYTTQSHFNVDDGRAIPDIQIEGLGFRCLIEVKVSVAVPFTKAQLDEYAGCFRSGTENHLCYLIPAGRRDYPSQDRDRIGPNGTQIHYRDWAGLIRVLLEELKTRPDAVLLEAARFWERTFSVVKMTEANMSFLNAWNGENYIAMRRLEQTVDQARKLFAVSDFETEAEYTGVSEYGFYLKRGKHYELWVGIWADLDTPLLFGLHQRNISWRRPCRPPQPELTFKNYDLWRLGAETWGDPNKLFEAVKAFRDGLVYED